MIRADLAGVEHQPVADADIRLTWVASFRFTTASNDLAPDER
jgi:hypothetical protein